MPLSFCVARGDGLTSTELTAEGQGIAWRGLIAWTAAVVVSLVVLGMLATTFFDTEPKMACLRAIFTDVADVCLS